MEKDKDLIELKSEKVRNIIGQIPPALIRNGMVLILFILILFLIASYLFKYEYVVETRATIENKDGKTIVSIEIPPSEIERIKPGQIIILDLSNIDGLNNRQIIKEISYIPNEMFIDNNKGVYFEKLFLESNELIINGRKIIVSGKMNIKAKIITEKIRFFDRIMQPVLSLFNND